MSSEFNNWYRHAGEQPLQRRGVKPPTSNSNGLSFEHVLSRLQVRFMPTFSHSRDPQSRQLSRTGRRSESVV